jgi:homeobox protein cut-like
MQCWHVIVINGCILQDVADDGSDLLPMEHLLSAKLKSLESELAQSRRLLFEAQQSETRNVETIAALRKSVESSGALISRLELDLEHQTNLANSAGAKRPGSNSKDSKSLVEMTAGSDKNAVSSSSLPRPFNNGKSSSRTGRDKFGQDDNYGSMELSELLGVDDNSSATTGANSNSMVTILQSQRDRYKDRLSQVEVTMVELQQQLQAAQTAKSQLEADNLALYEKIRYMQNYGSMQKNMKVWLPCVHHVPLIIMIHTGAHSLWGSKCTGIGKRRTRAWTER